MLEKISVIDKIIVHHNNNVQVFSIVGIEEDNIRISEKIEQRTIACGDDYSSEDKRVQAICATVHTEEVVAEYKAMFEKSQVNE